MFCGRSRIGGKPRATSPWPHPKSGTALEDSKQNQNINIQELISRLDSRTLLFAEKDVVRLSSSCVLSLDLL